MSDSVFVKRPPRRPRRYRVFELPEHSGFLHRVDTRPQRFLVGADEQVEPPEDQLSDAPVNTTLYLGRVDDVEDSIVSATVWEHPSGRQGMVFLEIDADFEGPEPCFGDLLRIWTWVELPGGGVVTPRKRVQVERRELSEAERAELQELVDRWKAEEE